MKRVVLSCILWICLVATWNVSAQPAQIILMRHAEKPEDENNPHLSKEGEERAQKLDKWLLKINMLGTNNLNGITRLFAAKPTIRLHGIRCMETLEPLSKKFKLPLSTPCLSADYKTMAKQLLDDPGLRGKSVLVCWTHEYLPDFAVALGVTNRPPKWKGDDYKSVYIISYDKNIASIRHDKQHFKD